MPIPTPQSWNYRSIQVNTVEIVHTPEPQTISEFLQYSCQLTLNPNTVFYNLHLTEGDQEVTMKGPKLCLNHPERFHILQVLCKNGLSGAHFNWEVEWRGKKAYIAVSYNNVSRMGFGPEAQFGLNDTYWGLLCTKEACSFHNNIETKLPAPGPESCRVGVYLDHRAGDLSFYSVSETITLLHTVQTVFTRATQPRGFGQS
ncbi:neoverrucotoxin subunit beta-like [Oncorhynchus clarkii lewisi]|uniref:neoverrucotoxin subunit beta-like n=1 Tax=Oncorhynchus clarkii lewisi TaxID=490388 RepID=UPI0039B8699E